METIKDEQLKTVIEHRCATYKSREEEEAYQANRRNTKANNKRVSIRHKIEDYQEEKRLRCELGYVL